MTNAFAASLKIADRLLGVRYRNESKAELAATCREWLATFRDEPAAIRASGCMVASKLDMFDKARLRVENVLQNCI